MDSFDLSPAMLAALDHPVWSALGSGHRALALGAGPARRYPREYGPFAALENASPAAWAALGELLAPGEAAMLVSAAEVTAAPGFTVTPLDPVWQMVATRDPGPAATRFELLGEADAPDMLSLATLTNPGPFATRTHQLGEFLGVREGDMLAAMTGERMRLDGLQEVSAVCVHPDHRGRAHARGLLVDKMRRMIDRGSIPFLHVYPSNRGAVALYESLGFAARRQLHLARVAQTG